MPAALNTAKTMTYGDGVWVKLTRAAVWEQPALPRVGTQDIWIVQSIEDPDGIEWLPQVLDHARADLDAPIALGPGLEFRRSRTVRGSAVAENNAPLDHIAVTPGIVSLTDAAGEFQRALLGDRNEALMLFSTPRLDQADYNLDLNDLLHFEIPEIAGLSSDDQLLIDLTFLQAAESGPPLAETQFSPIELLAHRWENGTVFARSALFEDGQQGLVRIMDVATTPAPDLGLTVAQLDQSKINYYITAKLTSAATAIAPGWAAAAGPPALLAAGIYFYGGTFLNVAGLLTGFFHGETETVVRVNGNHFEWKTDFTFEGEAPTRIEWDPDTGSWIVQTKEGTRRLLVIPGLERPPPKNPANVPPSSCIQQLSVSSLQAATGCQRNPGVFHVAALSGPSTLAVGEEGVFELVFRGGVGPFRVSPSAFEGGKLLSPAPSVETTDARTRRIRWTPEQAGEAA